MDERRLELKVGALILAALCGVVALLWMIGELRVSKKPSVHVELSHTGNVVVGAPVKLGGVRVGTVEAVVLRPEHRDEHGLPLPVTLDLAVEHDILAKLPADSEFAIATQGPLGEAYIEVTPGSAQAPAIAEGAVVRGSEGARLDRMLARMSALADAMSKAVGDDPQALGNLVKNVSGLTRTVDGVLTDNREQMKALVADLAVTVQQLRKDLEAGGKGDRLLDDAAASAQVMRKELPGLTADARTAMGGAAKVAGQFTKEDGERLKLAIQRYTEAGERLDSIAGRADRLLTQIDSGQGTLGGFVKDPQVYQDLRALLADLKAHPWKAVWKQ